MVKLKNILKLLPIYQKDTKYGKKGDIKKNVLFNFYNKGVFSFNELTNEMIENAEVIKITSNCNSYGKYASSYLEIICKEVD